MGFGVNISRIQEMLKKIAHAGSYKMQRRIYVPVVAKSRSAQSCRREVCLGVIVPKAKREKKDRVGENQPC